MNDKAGRCPKCPRPVPKYLLHCKNCGRQIWPDEPYDTQTCFELQDAKPEHYTPPALGGVAEREDEGNQRIRVVFKGYRVKLLDPDNFAGSCKDLLDGLRHAGLIPDDTAAKISFQTEQEKVGHYKEEKTEIEITYP